MALSAYERQKRHRARQAERAAAMEAALVEIVAMLAGNDKPLAVKVRARAEEGLKR